MRRKPLTLQLKPLTVPEDLFYEFEDSTREALKKYRRSLAAGEDSNQIALSLLMRLTAEKKRLRADPLIPGRNRKLRKLKELDLRVARQMNVKLWATPASSTGTPQNELEGGLFPRGTMRAKMVDSAIMAAGSAIGSKADDNSLRGALFGAMVGGGIVWMLTSLKVIHD